MTAYRQAQQAGRLPTARDVPFSLPRVLRDFTYSIKEGVLNVMRGGKFKDGFARAMATSSDPFAKEAGITMLGSRLERTLQHRGQPAGQPPHPTAVPATSVQASATSARTSQAISSGPPARHYTDSRYAAGQPAPAGSSQRAPSPGP
jgi:hypothetical protein